MKKSSLLVGLGSLLLAGVVFADGSPGPGTIGDMAATATQSASAVAGLALAVCYVAGLSLVITAFFKMKAHKDTPTQVPLSTGIVWLVLGSGLLFLPTIISSVGKTIFGSPGSLVSVYGSLNIAPTGGGAAPAKP